MIVDIFQKYADIIVTYDILKFKVVGASYQLVYTIELTGQTRLFAKDYLFLDGSRKYSFHWQDRQEHCIVRWDNVPHHVTVASFPHHKHLGNAEQVAESAPMQLETVLEYIRQRIT